MWDVFPFLYFPDEEPPQKLHLTAHIYVNALKCTKILYCVTHSDGNEASAGTSCASYRLVGQTGNRLLCDWASTGCCGIMWERYLTWFWELGFDFL